MNRAHTMIQRIKQAGRIGSWVGVMSGLLLMASLATAQGGRQSQMGTGNAATAGVLGSVSLGSIAASKVYTSASYATAGVGLRNQPGGGIVINGLSGAPKAAFLYWAVITQGAPLAPDQSITLQKLLPAASSSVSLTGTVIGAGAQPCWAGDRITVYRAAVPLTVATGNGFYKVVLKAGASGSTAGEDPWVGGGLPMFEGASLVLVGSGTSTVAIYDKALAANTFLGSLNYSLTLPKAAPGNATFWDNIGADGQHGISRIEDPSYDDITNINGLAVAGYGSIYNDSDWNGSAGLPLPQLWDDTGHNVTVATPMGTTSLNVTFYSQNDCLTPVANVVAVR
jgi:hypothetical protein